MKKYYFLILGLLVCRYLNAMEKEPGPDVEYAVTVTMAYEPPPAFTAEYPSMDTSYLSSPSLKRFAWSALTGLGAFATTTPFELQTTPVSVPITMLVTAGLSLATATAAYTLFRYHHFHLRREQWRKNHLSLPKEPV